MGTITQTPAIIPVADFKAVIETAPEALKLNTATVEGAKKAGQAILDTIEAVGMNEELDAAANDYLVKVRDRSEQIEQRRKPATKMFDDIKKVFTALEAEIDVKKPDSIPAKVQAARDAYAKKLRDEAAERERKAQLELARNKEKVDYRYKVETEINRAVIAKITGLKDKIYNQFNDATLDSMPEVENKLKTWTPSYPKETHMALPVLTGSSLLDSETMLAIVAEVKEETFLPNQKLYIDQLTEAATQLLDRVPGKIKELEEIKAAKGKEAARLIQEAADRKAKEDADRIIKEQEAKAKADQEAAAKKDAAMAETLFDHTAAQAEVSQPVASGREGFTIKVTNPAGYGLLFAFWLQQEGMKEDVSKLEKKTLGSIKTFCEKHAHKTGEKIESKFLEYEPTFKTTAKK